MKEKFNITGMTCAACSAHVEKAAKSVEGVQEAAVSLLTNSAQIVYEEPATRALICQAIKDAGYGAAVTSNGKAEINSSSTLEDQETPLLKKRLLFSLLFLIPLLCLSMGHMIALPLPEYLGSGTIGSGILQMFLSGIVMIINQKFFISGTKSVLKGAPNMDTLVALGAGAAFLYSFGALVRAVIIGYVSSVSIAEIKGICYYFESSAMILTLITVGKLLEARSKGKTTNALKGLMDLAPKTAVVLREGSEISIPVEDVRPGDQFVIRPGDTIPVDGRVIKGESAVNEASLTGESLPVDKEPGDPVSSGTINLNGHMICEATRVGEDTTIRQIIRMVEEASATKAPIAKLADQIAAVFVPAVTGIALLTAASWLIAGKDISFVVARAVSVLVISCPCALGLATPVAIMVGTGKGAKSGILYKTAAAMEQTGRIEFVVLDKTGTVTKGEPAVTEICPAEGISETELLRIAGAVEKQSEHPLAKAICHYAEAAGVQTGEAGAFKALPGAGLTAAWEGKTVYAGNPALMKAHGMCDENLMKKGESFAAQGKTPLYFSLDGRIIGMIAVADVIKEDSREAVKTLHNMGIETILLTGDNKRTARAVAAEAGISHVIADCRPEQKEAMIRKVCEQGITAMVGDGINDAPALTRADVGIAIGAGSDIAIDAADVVLMRSGLMDVAAAIRLSRQVLRNIKENLFWAFFYNILGIPLAAGLYYLFNDNLLLNPMFGAAAMSLSSFCVVTNALRLNAYNTGDPSKDHRYYKNLKTFIYEEEKGEEMMTKEMIVEGMMCQMCVKHVKKALEALEGVSAEVDLEQGLVTISCPEGTEDETLIHAVEEAEYVVKGIKTL